MSGWERMWSSNGGLQPGQAFDATKPLPFISTLFQMNLIPKGKGIVPGCGRGYAPRALSYGGRHCIGVDIAPTAVKAAAACYIGKIFVCISQCGNYGNLLTLLFTKISRKQRFY